MQARRRSDRTWAHQDAFIRFSGAARMRQCAVRDFSSDGVGIYLNGARVLSLDVELSLHADEAGVACRLVRRWGDYARFEFLRYGIRDRRTP
ncbi:PilZ domain-containing protein [Bradyrhizobium canariense]|uniref:PilZ domain-containing protein n=1 Tax=Bradyrhizobium canariense TaxID=255045 RepID=UPI0034DF3DEC